jgi:hypothetical protein
MQMIVKIIGIVIIVLSVVYILKPAVPRALIKFFKQGHRMYLAGLIRLIFAVIFLLAAGKCQYPKAIAAFGILFLISALLVFSLGAAKINRYMEWWQKQSDILLRIISLVALAIGSAIIYFA